MLAREVFKNTLYHTASILISRLVGILITIYVERVLKPELFGLYSLVISIVFVLLTFTDVGTGTTVERYGAYACSIKDYELVRGYVRSLSKLKISLVFLVSILLFFLSDYISITVFKKPMLSKPLKVVSIFITFFSLAGFVNSIFNAFNDFKANFVRSLFYEISRLVLIVLFVSMGLSVVGALLGFTVASLMIVSIFLFLTSDLLSSYVFNKPISTYLKLMTLYIVFFSLSGFITRIFHAFNDFRADFVRFITYEFSRLFFIVVFVSMGWAVIGALLGFCCGILYLANCFDRFTYPRLSVFNRW